MAFQVSPGVNVSEIDLTTVIPAVSTTEAGYAGHFRWGPVGQRVLITSEDDLVSNFQKPLTSNTATDFFVAKNFLAYGNALFTVRVINETGSDSVLAGRNAISNSANTKNTVVKSDKDYDENYSSGISGVGNWIARYPGELGNSLKVSVCASSNAFSSSLTGNVQPVNGSKTLAGLGTLFQSEVRVGDILVLGPDKELRKVASIASNTSLTLTDKYTGNSVGAASSNSSHNASVSTPERRWEFHNFFDKAPGTSDAANTAGGNGDEVHIVVADEDGEWSGTLNTVLEKFERLSLASDAKTEEGATNYYVDVINDNSKYIWWAKHNGAHTNSGSKKTASFSGSPLPATDSLVLGRDGAAPRNADHINGYNEFKSAEDVDVSLILGGDNNGTVVEHIIGNICESRKDCIVVISPERGDVVANDSYSGKQAEDVVAYRDTLTSTSYAVMDAGWKYQYDKYNDIQRYVPANGDTAGLMVRTDLTRDPWYSPAGFNRGIMKNVTRLAFNPNKAERDLLYKNGVNPVVTFPGQGTVLFGDKTLLAKPSAFDRINVRRLFIVLEKAISTAAKFTLFEFNDAFTRSQFVNLVDPFLRDVQARRGIQDFRVVCDETNNTPEVIDRNEFIGDIYIKPARSINFIQLNFIAVRTGVEFSEIVGQF
jgi:phage tail sheath protein FI